MPELLSAVLVLKNSLHGILLLSCMLSSASSIAGSCGPPALLDWLAVHALVLSATRALLQLVILWRMVLASLPAPSATGFGQSRGDWLECGFSRSGPGARAVIRYFVRDTLLWFVGGMADLYTLEHQCAASPWLGQCGRVGVSIASAFWLLASLPWSGCAENSLKTLALVSSSEDGVKGGRKGMRRYP